MNKKTFLTSSITVGGYLLLVLLSFLINSNEVKNILVMLGIFGGAGLFVTGIVLCFFDSTIPYGVGLIISSVLIFIIGFGVCTSTFASH